MTVEEALEFFRNIPPIARKLQTIHDVGLDYIQLGQPATTLSGGEAQRVKLATELSRRDTGRCQQEERAKTPHGNSTLPELPDASRYSRSQAPMPFSTARR